MGPRTRGAIRTFQDLNGLAITGTLTGPTLERLFGPDAKAMTTGTRDATTAAELAAAGSGTVKATNTADALMAVSTAAQTGNTITDAAQALAEADKAIKVVEGGRTLGARMVDLGVWAATPRGAALLASVVASLFVWWLIRRIRARRVAAHQAGRQA
jgi:peptidoglycan hydrolase-like protein with peptidoglycan-binding domain